MARKIRKNQNIISVGAEPKVQPATEYSVGLYARLSVDNKQKQENGSIENQIRMLDDYVAEQPNMKTYAVYADNGRTGTNFDRPQFLQMMEDVKERRVNCVVVKDLSRLGRNHIETGNYIENIFPFLGLRFIAINDGYDSITTKNKDIGLVLPLKNIINEVYAKDISTKVISQFAVKQKKGEFLGSFAPYGYKRLQSDRHKLVVDPKAAEVVREIFLLKLGGKTNGEIARVLNAGAVLPPTAYRQKGEAVGEGINSKLWHKSTINRILTNPVYTGQMVQGKEKSRHFGSGKRQAVAPRDWVTVKGTHEGIINADVFEAVQEILRHGGSTA